MQNNFSFVKLFTGGDVIVIAVSLLLILGSIISWVIIVEKIRRWR